MTATTISRAVRPRQGLYLAQRDTRPALTAELHVLFTISVRYPAILSLGARSLMCARVAHIARAKLVAIAPGTLSTTQILPRVQTDIVPLDANLPEEEVAARVQWRAAHGQHVQTLVATLTSGQLHKALAFRRDELPPKLSMLVTESLGVSE